MDASNVERTLGRLEGQLTLVMRSVDTVHAELKTMAELSHAERARVATAIQSVGGQVQDLHTEVNAVKPKVDDLVKKMERVVPVVDQVTRWRTTGAGVILGISAVAAVFSTVISSAKEKLIQFFLG